MLDPSAAGGRGACSTGAWTAAATGGCGDGAAGGCGDGAAAGDGAADGCGDGAIMPGGYQPPPEHTHSGPGCTVVHPVAGTKVAAGEPVDCEAVGGTIPGGYQPPLAQTQSGPGRTVVHAIDDDGGGAAGVPAGGVIPGGSQPPFEHVQSGPGRTVVHSTDCAEAALLMANTLNTNTIRTKILCKTLTPLIAVKPAKRRSFARAVLAETRCAGDLSEQASARRRTSSSRASAGSLTVLETK